MPDGQGWTTDWLEGQIAAFEKEVPAYALYAELLDEVLRRACQMYGLDAIVQSRAKSMPSFAEKCIRKWPKYKDPVHQMTDLCGARAVATTQADVDRIARFLRTHFQVDEENSPDVAARLAVGEFGYLSVHIVAQLPRARLVKASPEDLEKEDAEAARLRRIITDFAGRKNLDALAVIDQIGARKAEFQVCTLAQHAYAAISHDRAYKSEFGVPASWERELRRVAALLEHADNQFGRTVEALDAYKLTYGVYLTRDQFEAEMARCEAVLAHDQTNVALAHRIARLAISRQDWDKVIQVLEPHRDRVPERSYVLRDLGLARTRKQRTDREDLRKATALDPHDPDAFCYLGDSYCRFPAWCPKTDEERADCAEACKAYESAYRLAPAEPHVLSSYLGCKLCDQGDFNSLSLLRPGLEEAIRKCEERARAGVYVPHAYYHIGEFWLLLGEPYKSLAAYAKAVHRSEGPEPIALALKTAETLQAAAAKALDQRAGSRTDTTSADSLARWMRWCEWVRRFLLVAREAKTLRCEERGMGALGEAARKKKARELLHRTREVLGPLATKDAKPIKGTVVMVAGGCAETFEDQVREYLVPMVGAFEGFRGTIISGGTVAGVCGLVGRLNAGTGIRRIGYIDPRNPPKDAQVDRRNYEIREPCGVAAASAGQGGDPIESFTALEPLQAWIDLLVDGTKPWRVNLLGINGGPISAFEYRLALSLGATVGILEASGRAASELEAEAALWGTETLVWLPLDAMTLWAFVHSAASSEMKPDQLERGAMAAHDKFCEAHRRDNTDPALQPFPQLPPDLQDSNRQQVAYAANILATEGFGVRDRTGRGAVDSLEGPRFKEKVERMAEKEHGRFVVERLKAGWRYGKQRDVGKKTSPYLVPWKELPPDAQDKDRKAILDLPAVLARADLEIFEK